MAPLPGPQKVTKSLRVTDMFSLCCFNTSFRIVQPPIPIGFGRMRLIALNISVVYIEGKGDVIVAMYEEEGFSFR